MLTLQMTWHSRNHSLFLHGDTKSHADFGFYMGEANMLCSKHALSHPVCACTNHDVSKKEYSCEAIQHTALLYACPS